MESQHTPVLPDPVSPLELPLRTLTPPLDWDALFGRPGPRAIEVGTGNGLFLAAEAARLPDWNFIGIEREWEFYLKMVRRLEREGAANVRTTPCDALDLLADWIAPGTTDRLYCYFSDPWPKRRHAGRRVFTPESLPLFERLLAPGGQIWFKTDVPFLFNLTVTLFRQHGGWRLLEIGRLPPPDPAKGEALTNFERKARESGSEVWGFKAERKKINCEE